MEEAFTMTETTKPKPEARLIGRDSNIFNLVALASRALKKAGQPEHARTMHERVMQAESYGAALAIIAEYVEIV